LETKQQAERKAYFENPVNAERPLRTVGGTRVVRRELTIERVVKNEYFRRDDLSRQNKPLP
jgi:hypothetical protein